MSIQYTKLFQLISERKISKTELQKRIGMSLTTIAMEKEETASIDDIIETVNHFQCFDYMLDIADQKLLENRIKDFHKILKNNTSDSRKEWFNAGD